MAKTYRLVNYFDVYKDVDDVWIVNNCCVECEDLVIADDATDKEIVTYLRDAGYLTTNDMRKVGVEDYGEYIEIYAKKECMPLFRLEEVI